MGSLREVLFRQALEAGAGRVDLCRNHAGGAFDGVDVRVDGGGIRRRPGRFAGNRAVRLGIGARSRLGRRIAGRSHLGRPAAGRIGLQIRAWPSVGVGVGVGWSLRVERGLGTRAGVDLRGGIRRAVPGQTARVGRGRGSGGETSGCRCARALMGGAGWRARRRGGGRSGEARRTDGRCGGNSAVDRQVRIGTVFGRAHHLLRHRWIGCRAGLWPRGGSRREVRMRGRVGRGSSLSRRRIGLGRGRRGYPISPDLGNDVGDGGIRWCRGCRRGGGFRIGGSRGGSGRRGGGSGVGGRRDGGSARFARRRTGAGVVRG